MTLKKWLDIYEEECFKKEKDLFRNAPTVNPQSWSECKKAYLEFIKSIDEATEVYNMEVYDMPISGKTK
jgi:hypothetical protein